MERMILHLQKALASISKLETQKASSEKRYIFLKCFQPIVLLGKFLGVLIWGDVCNANDQGTSRRRCYILRVLCSVLTIFYFINAVLVTFANVSRIKRIKVDSEKFSELHLPFYAFTMCFVYSYQIVATKQLQIVVNGFTKVCKKDTRFTTRFLRVSWTILVINMSFGITENIFYDVQSVRKTEAINSTMQRYYTAVFYHWAEVIPYHHGTTIFLTIMIKLGTWGWVFMDILVIFLCRAVSERFRMLNEQTIGRVNSSENQLFHMNGNLKQALIKLKNCEPNEDHGFPWETVRDEFLTLIKLCREVEKFVGPLILACYGANMYIIVVMLLNWIAPYSAFSVEQSYYTYFAFIQFLFRVISITYFAAEVHHESSEMFEVLQQCPNTFYNLSMERLERRLIFNPPGISLFGTFTITRSFYISIVSFIFTTEIVLLQSANKAAN